MRSTAKWETAAYPGYALHAKWEMAAYLGYALHCEVGDSRISRICGLSLLGGGEHIWDMQFYIVMRGGFSEKILI